MNRKLSQRDLVKRTVETLAELDKLPEEDFYVENAIMYQGFLEHCYPGLLSRNQ